MRAAAPAERLGVVAEPFGVGREALGAHAGAEVGGVVDALGAGHDLLAAHEEVVRVGQGRVVGGGVRVEGAEGARVLVDGVEVRAVLLEDDSAEGFFLGGASRAELVWGGLLSWSWDAGRCGWKHGEMVGHARWDAYSMSECGSPPSIPASDRSALASANVMRTALSPGGSWKVPASG